MSGVKRLAPTLAPSSASSGCPPDAAEGSPEQACGLRSEGHVKSPRDASCRPTAARRYMGLDVRAHRLAKFGAKPTHMPLTAHNRCGAQESA